MRRQEEGKLDSRGENKVGGGMRRENEGDRGRKLYEE